MNDHAYAPCPRCGSRNVSRERSPDGDTVCWDCELKIPHAEWDERMEAADKDDADESGG